MDENQTESPTSREASARTCLIVSGLLLVPGAVVISSVAGVAAFMLAAVFAISGLCLGYKRYPKIGITLLILSIALTLWRLPDAREDYGRYIDQAKQHTSR